MSDLAVNGLPDQVDLLVISSGAGDIGASAGLMCDATARVLDERGEPISGLYACGADMESIMAGCYPGPGITLGPAMTFGYLAACHAAASIKGDSE